MNENLKKIGDVMKYRRLGSTELNVSVAGVSPHENLHFIGYLVKDDMKSLCPGFFHKLMPHRTTEDHANEAKYTKACGTG